MQGVRSINGTNDVRSRFFFGSANRSRLSGGFKDLTRTCYLFAGFRTRLIPGDPFMERGQDRTRSCFRGFVWMVSWNGL
jgi:hypothetical protein